MDALVHFLALAPTGPVAQVGTDVSVDVGSGAGLVGGAVGAFLTTLIVGGVMVALAPDYTERMMATVVDDPVGSLVYGFVALIGLILVVLLLAITVVGILVVIPLGIAAYLVWAVGAAIAYLAVADRLVGHDDGWLKPLLIGAAINGGLALTGVGGVVALCIGAAGFGAVLRDWRG